jgi:hypothetical protein
MAGLVPASHVVEPPILGETIGTRRAKLSGKSQAFVGLIDMDGRDEPGHYEAVRFGDFAASPEGELPFRWRFSQHHLGMFDAVGAASTPSPETP